MNFPFDWIQPGERYYCSCGKYLIIPHTGSCEACKGNPEKAIDVHNYLEDLTTKLAAARKDSNVPRLFWMKEP